MAKKTITVREKEMVTAAFNLGVHVGEQGEKARILAGVAVSDKPQDSAEVLHASRDKS